MNEMDVDDVLGRFFNGPNHIRGATQFLCGFKNLINSISDGWAYWSYGTKCSGDLQKIVEKCKWPVNWLQCSVTHAEVRAAEAKVCRFLKWCRQTKSKPEVLEFLRRVEIGEYK